MSYRFADSLRAGSGRNSWRWTGELPETCRILFQEQIWEISASGWFYYKNVSRYTVSWTSRSFLLVRTIYRNVSTSNSDPGESPKIKKTTNIHSTAKVWSQELISKDTCPIIPHITLQGLVVSMHTVSFNVKQAGTIPSGLIYLFLYDSHHKQTSFRTRH